MKANHKGARDLFDVICRFDLDPDTIEHPLDTESSWVARWNLDERAFSISAAGTGNVVGCVVSVDPKYRGIAWKRSLTADDLGDIITNSLSELASVLPQQEKTP